jgi:hypothetical protein
MNGFACLDVSEAVCAVGDLDRIDRAYCKTRLSAKVLIAAVEGLLSRS